MRSISNFPTGRNRKQGRTITNSISNSSNGWRQPAPVWGRSAASVVAISSSPSNSSFGSSNSSNSSNSSARSLSRSPVRQSRVWGGSARVKAATQSPRQKQKETSRSQSFSPQQQSPDDYRDEVTTTTTAPSQPLVYQQRQLLAPQALSSSSSPRPPHELCTIAEDRKISSNTLSQMAITSTAEQIAKSPVLAKSLPLKQQQQQQQQQQRNQRNAEFRDPYNDDSYNDSRDMDCADCWSYHKSGFKNWWPFANQSAARSTNNIIITNKHMGNFGTSRNIAGFRNIHRRTRVRATSF